MPIISKQDHWKLGTNRDGYSAQLFKADEYGNLDFSMTVNYKTTEDKSRAKLMRRAPEMLAAQQDVKALWDEHGFGDNDDVSTPLYNRLKKLIAGV